MLPGTHTHTGYTSSWQRVLLKFCSKWNQMNYMKSNELSVISLTTSSWSHLLKCSHNKKQCDVLHDFAHWVSVHAHTQSLTTHNAAARSWQFLPLPRRSPPFRDFHLWVHDPFFSLDLSFIAASLPRESDTADLKETGRHFSQDSRWNVTTAFSSSVFVNKRL